MSPASRFYHVLHHFLSQSPITWQDARPLQTLCWMMVAILQGETVHLSHFGGFMCKAVPPTPSPINGDFGAGCPIGGLTSWLLINR